MKPSVPFLATSFDQMPKPGQYGQEAVEAIAFNRESLDKENWALLWKHMAIAVSLYGGDKVTFHFPFLGCDPVGDPFVRSRLSEGLQRASDLGLQGIVLHASQGNTSTLSSSSLQDKRVRTVESLHDLKSRSSGRTWLGLECMALEIDPAKEVDALFLFPSDFFSLRGSELKVVWDLCHFAKTLYSLENLSKQGAKRFGFPLPKLEPLSFLALKDLIVHFHFSAFIPLIDPKGRVHMQEGQPPFFPLANESLYQKMLEGVETHFGDLPLMVFEIEEKDYILRERAPQTIAWAERITTHKPWAAGY